MRQVILDTETTGMEPEQGHRVIEIGAVELVNRRLTGRTFHEYVNPERQIDRSAQEVHGITGEFLEDKPRFDQVARDFLDFIKDAEVVIHNAGFDVAFLDSEFSLLGDDYGRVEDHCTVTDSLELAKQKHPGQRNTLDALCTRYQVDNSQRRQHGALLDASLLADVFLLLTGGQATLGLAETAEAQVGAALIGRLEGRKPGRVLAASGDELKAHEVFLDQLEETGAEVVWRRGKPG